jgi:hypothetical protein
VLALAAEGWEVGVLEAFMPHIVAIAKAIGTRRGPMRICADRRPSLRYNGP